MATGSLYGSVSESTGLYGIGAASGGTYFEWFIFQDSATAPATPTGGSWSFTNNTGTAPTGWVVSPPPAPVNQVWVSIAVVDSRNATTFTWSVPGLMTGSGLPILTGAGVPSSGTGLNGQLYINTSTTPQSLYNKQTGAWVQLSGSNLVDLVNNQTIGGVKTFSQTIQGSISGNAGNVSGTVAVVNGGTGATTASDARTNLGLGTIATQAASNVAITGGSITGITDLAVADGGTGASTAANARTNLGAVGLTDTQTLTNKSISGSANTLTNIPNSALVYDSVNINSVDFTLGAVQTIGADWILPSYAGNAGKVLALNTSASDVEWVPAAGVGTVTSVAVSGGTTGLTSSGGPITAAGTITLGGTLSLLNGGTGQTTANAAFNALVPLQTGNSGKYLTTNGTDTSWAANPLGTVTSVSGTGTVSGLTLTGTVTTSGNLTLGGTLNLSAPPAIGGTTPNTGVFTNLTVNDNTILGSSNSDTVNFNARVNSDIDPSTDNTYDLGRNAHAWRNLYLTGTANIAALTASGAVTFSGGTANGVAYLNGSKVLTTGSALTFNGTRFSTYVTSDTNTNIARFGVVNTAVTDDAFLDISADAANNLITLNSTGNNAGSFAFQTGGSEQMRLTSTGLGIGTSSPAYKLDVRASSTPTIRVLETTNGPDGRFLASASDVQIGTYGGSPLSFYTNSTEKMRLDTSGNLGIGTSSPFTGLTLIKYGTQWTNHTANTYPQPAGNTFLQMEAVAGQTNWFGFTGSYGATSGSANLLLQVTLNNLNQQAGNYIASEAQSAIASDLTFGKMIGGASSGGNSSKSEQMRLDSSGNLGIGTSSPSQKLHVVGNALVTPSGGWTTGGVATQYFGDIYGSIKYDYNTTDFLISSYGTFSIATNGTTPTTRLTIDSSGNLGLGVTPSAWNAVFKVTDIANGAAIFGQTNSNDSGGFVTNAYYGASSYIYKNSAAAALYYQTGGQHQWRTAPSGTAGNAISFSQAMTLDADGDLGIGTTSPAYKLDVLGTSRIYQSGNTAASLLLNANQGTIGTGYAFSLAQTNSSGNYSFTISEGATTYLTLSNSIGGAGGNLGLGVTPSAWTSAFKAFQVGATGSLVYNGSTDVYLSNNYASIGGASKYITTAAATLYQQGAGTHAWYTAASGTAGDAISFTQALTLDASGNLMAGVTSTSFRINATVASGADRDIFAAQISGASNGLTVKWNHATTTTRVNISNLPTSATGLASGDLYVLAGALMVA